MTGEPANLRIDLERLLNPISVEHPAGESLRYEGTYDQVRAARREDDAELSQGIYVTDLKRADWPAALALVLEVGHHAPRRGERAVRGGVWVGAGVHGDEAILVVDLHAGVSLEGCRSRPRREAGPLRRGPVNWVARGAGSRRGRAAVLRSGATT